MFGDFQTRKNVSRKLVCWENVVMFDFEHFLV